MLQQLSPLPEHLSQYSDKISQLCMSNPQFAGLYTQFDKVNGEVHRLSISPEKTSFYLTNLKKSQTYLQHRLEDFLQTD
ncbi:hypothetical protein [Candidatus Albibeggiatoa sp. nov. NOAA]|uniref:hypothetical protein n=1 Tax=Candidatus Albibeggiatoa sp. nov. NOAA TaxID=3162724 RepID=UPI0032F94E7B|nr:hypothetical protein [Thiotrichaceae bacterium]